MSLGDNVISLRGKSKYSQKQLAQEAGIAQSTLSDIENNINFPNTTTLIKLSKALNCELDDIVTENVSTTQKGGKS